VDFKGGILGGARQFWGNPYLNSMTVLFDTTTLIDQIPTPISMQYQSQFMNHQS